MAKKTVKIEFIRTYNDADNVTRFRGDVLDVSEKVAERYIKEKVAKKHIPAPSIPEKVKGNKK